jgi:hypothetical protein
MYVFIYFYFLNEGAFLYSRSSELTSSMMQSAFSVIEKSGLNPKDFCIIRNQCFSSKNNNNNYNINNNNINSNVINNKFSNNIDDNNNNNDNFNNNNNNNNNDEVDFKTFSIADDDNNHNYNQKNNINSDQINNIKEDAPFWYLGQKFFQASNAIAEELADWFEDPAIVSDWLVKQQQRIILDQPFVLKLLLLFLLFIYFYTVYMIFEGLFIAVIIIII